MPVTSIVNSTNTLSFFDGVTLFRDVIKQNITNIEINPDNIGALIVSANNGNNVTKVDVVYADITAPVTANIAALRTQLINWTKEASSSAGIGSTTDSEATTDTGNFSLISLFKRYLVTFTMRFPRIANNAQFVTAQAANAPYNSPAIDTLGHQYMEMQLNSTNFDQATGIMQMQGSSVPNPGVNDWVTISGAAVTCQSNSNTNVVRNTACTSRWMRFIWIPNTVTTGTFDAFYSLK